MIFLFIAIFALTAGMAVFAFSMTWTFGDPFGELTSYGDDQVANLASVLHMFVGLFMGGLAVFCLLSFPVSSSQKVFDEYTYERNLSKTLFIAESDTLKTDRAVWANLADNPGEYCLYETTTYNVFGSELESNLGIQRSPCEPKYLFMNRNFNQDER